MACNIEIIANIFPNCIVESVDELGGLRRSVDFDQLRQELTPLVVEGPQERYRIDWPGKRNSIFSANSPIAKTLRPTNYGAENFFETRNIFIEGDNLDALKLLQETYLGRIKLIYIDPPYNTGHDFIYSDTFAEGATDYLRKSNQTDQEGSRMVANTESIGRFHSAWMTMMYPRLKLCRNLLSDNGVVFLSIDDNELKNLQFICDEIFGANNFLGCIPVINNLKGRQTKFQAKIHEYMLCYRKSSFESMGLEMTSEQLSEFDQMDSDGRRYKWDDLRKRGGEDRRIDRPDMHFQLYVDPSDGSVTIDKDIRHKEIAAPIKSDGEDGRWRWGKQRVTADVANLRGRLSAGGGWKIEYKNYLDSEDGEKRSLPKSVWQGSQFSTDAGTRALSSLIPGINAKEFAPKAVEQIKQIIELATTHDDIILDIFAGSGTTAQAVMELNQQHLSRRRFILIQIEERSPEKSAAYKSGFKDIASICMERIRRCGDKIKSDSKISFPDLDVGFRALRVDTSNMSDQYYSPDELQQAKLDLYVDNVKAERSPEDLLFQVLLDWGVDLALPVYKQVIQGLETFFVENNAVVACFDSTGSIDEDFAKELVKHQPLRVVFRDSGFKDSAIKVNIEQIFKLLSPTTEVKSI